LVIAYRLLGSGSCKVVRKTLLRCALRGATSCRRLAHLLARQSGGWETWVIKIDEQTAVTIPFSETSVVVNWCDVS